jgi:hypothetical protein
LKNALLISGGRKHIEGDWLPTILLVHPTGWQWSRFLRMKSPEPKVSWNGLSRIHSNVQRELSISISLN